MKAFKLININGSESSFQEGSIPEREHIKADYFFAQTSVDPYQLSSHPAPRCQFVVTLQGKLRFTVTNGDSFIIEPGVMLIAHDVHGAGHTWQLIEGDTWNRIYIVPESGSEDLFIALNNVV